MSSGDQQKRFHNGSGSHFRLLTPNGRRAKMRAARATDRPSYFCLRHSSMPSVRPHVWIRVRPAALQARRSRNTRLALEHTSPSQVNLKAALAPHLTRAEFALAGEKESTRQGCSIVCISMKAATATRFVTHVTTIIWSASGAALSFHSVDARFRRMPSTWRMNCGSTWRCTGIARRARGYDSRGANEAKARVTHCCHGPGPCRCSDSIPMGPPSS